jgi:VWFA-related protein
MAFRTKVWPGARVPFFVIALIAAVPVLRAAGPQTPATPQTSAPTQAQAPIFRSGVDLVLVDATVVDRDGTPVKDLKPEDFQVTINGHPRRVVRADFVKYATGPRDPSAEGASVVYNPGSEDIAPEAPRGRIFVVAIDDTSFSATSMMSATKSVQYFIDHLEPEDLVGIYTYPIGAVQVDLKHDHVSIEQTLRTVQGLRNPVQQIGEFGLSASEIVDISAGDSTATNLALARGCPPPLGSGRNAPSSFQIQESTDGRSMPNVDIGCARALVAEAHEMAGYLETEGLSSLGRLRRLFVGLSALPYRKTVLVLSGGLISADRASARPDLRSQTQVLGKMAAAAGVNLYIVQMDTSFSDQFLPSRSQDMMGFTARNQLRESSVLSTGLDMLAGDTGAARFNINAGTGAAIFDRVLRETASYYLLGVAPEDADRDGQFHFIRVNVDAPHATVRARAEVIVPRKITQ